MEQNIIKTALTTVGAFFTALFGNLAIPITILMLLNSVDYGTGLIADHIEARSGIATKALMGLQRKCVCGCSLVSV